jgi:hypothetical protein
VNVTWISPVLYSALNASTPSTLTAITAYSRLMTPGSSGSGGGPWPGAFVNAKATTEPTAIGTRGPSGYPRVQAVDRLVEHQHRRVAEQRGGDAEPLLHAERETADPAPGHRLEPGQPQDRGDTLPGYPVGLRDRPQVRPGGPAGVQGGRVEQRADLAQRPDQPVVAAAADQGPAGGWRGQTENDPHRGGLARAVRAEEAGHPPRADGEAQVVDRGDRAEALAEPLHLDHAAPPVSHARRRPSSAGSTVTARLASTTWVRRSRTRLRSIATASKPAPP